MRKAARRVAHAIRQGAERHAEQAGPGRFEGTLTRWNDQDNFTLDLHGLDTELDEQDVVLGQSVRKYDADTGLEAGDNLILVEVGDRDYVAVEVVSDN